MTPPQAAKNRLDSVKFRRACMGALIIACAFLVMHAIFGDNGLLALRRQKQEYKRLQRQVQELQRENRRLELQNNRLESDPKAIESVAREQLRLARPGEIIYTLPEEPASNSTTHSKPARK